MMSKQVAKQKLAKLSKKVKLSAGDKKLLAEIAVLNATGKKAEVYKGSGRSDAFELHNKIQRTLKENGWRHGYCLARKENANTYCGSCVNRVNDGLVHFYVESGLMKKDGIVGKRVNRSTGELILEDSQLNETEPLMVLPKEKKDNNTPKQPSEDDGKTDEG